MKKLHLFVVLSLVLSLCPFSYAAEKTEKPVFDQVLVYERPYDFTFLRTLEALNSVQGWTLEETDKNKGLIVLRNVEYGNLFDRDKWVVRFSVISLGRKKTSISLEPESQHNKMGGDLLSRIDKFMNFSSSLKGEQPVVAMN